MREIRTEELFKKHEDTWDHGQPFREQRQSCLALRTYRSLTWLHYARGEPSDRFTPFVFYWIAFSALYSAEQQGPEETESEAQREYLKRLLSDPDAAGSIHDLLRGLEKTIDVLVIETPVYGRHLGEGRERADARGRDGAQTAGKVRHALKVQRDTGFVLREVVKRIYSIRNWLFHGGVARESHILGKPVMAGTDILTRLVPACVDAMLARQWPDDYWGSLPYSPDEYAVDTVHTERPDMREGPGRHR